ncbi:unnamed protein product, partial [Ectocarpus sp. 12 AP-2014]
GCGSPGCTHVALRRSYVDYRTRRARFRSKHEACERREREREAEDRMLLSPPVRKVPPSEHCFNTSSEHTKEGGTCTASSRCEPALFSVRNVCSIQPAHHTQTR